MARRLTDTAAPRRAPRRRGTSSRAPASRSSRDRARTRRAAIAGLRERRPRARTARRRAGSRRGSPWAAARNAAIAPGRSPRSSRRMRPSSSCASSSQIEKYEPGAERDLARREQRAQPRRPRPCGSPSARDSRARVPARVVAQAAARDSRPGSGRRARARPAGFASSCSARSASDHTRLSATCGLGERREQLARAGRRARARRGARPSASSVLSASPASASSGQSVTTRHSAVHAATSSPARSSSSPARYDGDRGGRGIVGRARRDREVRRDRLGACGRRARAPRASPSSASAHAALRAPRAAAARRHVLCAARYAASAPSTSPRVGAPLRGRRARRASPAPSTRAAARRRAARGARITRAWRRSPRSPCAARSTPSRSTSRWVTARIRCAPAAPSRTPSSRARADHGVGACRASRSIITMLVCTRVEVDAEVRRAWRAPRRARARSRDPRRAARGGARARTARRPRGCRPGACRRRASCAAGDSALMKLARARDDRADRRAEALRQADADRVEAGGELALGRAGRDRGVPQPRAVEVRRHPERVRGLRSTSASCARSQQMPPRHVVRVLDRDDARRRDVRIVGDLNAARTSAAVNRCRPP